MKTGGHLKFISTFLSVVLLTETVFAHAPEVNFWKERQQHVLAVSRPSGESRGPVLNLRSAAADDKSNLSPFGTLRKTSNAQASNSQTIIHIQDIHQNLEAQTNISNAIRQLLNEGKADLIALEGAAGPLDFAGFKEFPDQISVKKAADMFLNENKMSGAVHAVLTSDTTSLPSIVGIDDSLHYNANVKAYREASKQTDREKRRIEIRKAELQREKETALNRQLYFFDQQVEAYRDGKSTLGDHASLFVEAKNAPALKKLTAALALEKSLDFKTVENERNTVIAKLLQNAPEKDGSVLINASVAYRAGQISHTDFYSLVSAFCRSHHIDLKKFAALDAYFQYVLLTQSIDTETVLQELHEQENLRYEQLAATKHERELVKESRKLYLTGKLVDFALTKTEWTEYASAGNLLEPFAAFYREADTRDQKMATNLLNAIKEHRAKNVVLVTGGFHAKGIHESTNRRINGFSYVSFIPKITQLDTANGSTYLSIFAQEKTPLEKLFQGEKLFLNTPQWTLPETIRVAARTLALHVASVGRHVTNGRLAAYFSRMTSLALEQFSIVINGARFLIRFNKPASATISINNRGILTEDISAPPVNSLYYLGLLLNNPNYVREHPVRSAALGLTQAILTEGGPVVVLSLFSPVFGFLLCLIWIPLLLATHYEFQKKLDGKFSGLSIIAFLPYYLIPILNSYFQTNVSILWALAGHFLYDIVVMARQTLRLKIIPGPVVVIGGEEDLATLLGGFSKYPMVQNSETMKAVIPFSYNAGNSAYLQEQIKHIWEKALFMRAVAWLGTHSPQTGALVRKIYRFFGIEIVTTIPTPGVFMHGFGIGGKREIINRIMLYRASDDALRANAVVNEVEKEVKKRVANFDQDNDLQALFRLLRHYAEIVDTRLIERWGLDITGWHDDASGTSRPTSVQNILCLGLLLEASKPGRINVRRYRKATQHVADVLKAPAIPIHSSLWSHNEAQPVGTFAQAQELSLPDGSRVFSNKINGQYAMKVVSHDPLREIQMRDPKTNRRVSSPATAEAVRAIVETHQLVLAPENIETDVAALLSSPEIKQALLKRKQEGKITDLVLPVSSKHGNPKILNEQFDRLWQENFGVGLAAVVSHVLINDVELDMDLRIQEQAMSIFKRDNVSPIFVEQEFVEQLKQKGVHVFSGPLADIQPVLSEGLGSGKPVMDYRVAPNRLAFVLKMQSIYHTTGLAPIWVTDIDGTIKPSGPTPLPEREATAIALALMAEAPIVPSTGGADDVVERVTTSQIKKQLSARDRLHQLDLLPIQTVAGSRTTVYDPSNDAHEFVAGVNLAEEIGQEKFERLRHIFDELAARFNLGERNRNLGLKGENQNGFWGSYYDDRVAGVTFAVIGKDAPQEAIDRYADLGGKKLNQAYLDFLTDRCREEKIPMKWTFGSEFQIDGTLEYLDKGDGLTFLGRLIDYPLEAMIFSADNIRWTLSGMPGNDSKGAQRAGFSVNLDGEDLDEPVSGKTVITASRPGKDGGSLPYAVLYRRFYETNVAPEKKDFRARMDRGIAREQEKKKALSPEFIRKVLSDVLAPGLNTKTVDALNGIVYGIDILITKGNVEDWFLCLRVLKEIVRWDFPETAFARIRQLLRTLARKTNEKDYDAWLASSPEASQHPYIDVESLPSLSMEVQKKALKLANPVFSRGEVGYVILLDEDAFDGEAIQRQFNHIQKNHPASGTKIPVTIVAGFKNYKQLVSFLKKNNFFGFSEEQLSVDYHGVYQSISAATKTPFYTRTIERRRRHLGTTGTLGGLLAPRASGTFAQWASAGVKTVIIVRPNTLPSADQFDRLLVGHHLHHKSDFTASVTQNNGPSNEARLVYRPGEETLELKEAQELAPEAATKIVHFPRDAISLRVLLEESLLTPLDAPLTVRLSFKEGIRTVAIDQFKRPMSQLTSRLKTSYLPVTAESNDESRFSLLHVLRLLVGNFVQRIESLFTRTQIGSSIAIDKLEFILGLKVPAYAAVPTPNQRNLNFMSSQAREDSPVDVFQTPARNLDGFLDDLEDLLKADNANFDALYSKIQNSLSGLRAKSALAEQMGVWHRIPFERGLMDVLLGISFFILDHDAAGVTAEQLDRFETLLTAWTQKIQEREPNRFSVSDGHQWDHLIGYFTVPFLMKLCVSARFTRKAEFIFDRMNAAVFRLPGRYRDAAVRIHMRSLAVHLGPSIDFLEQDDIKSVNRCLRYALGEIRAGRDVQEWERAAGTLLAGLAINGDNAVTRIEDMKPKLWGQRLINDETWQPLQAEFQELLATYKSQAISSIRRAKKEAHGNHRRSWLAQRWIFLYKFVQALSPWQAGDKKIEAYTTGPQNYEDPFFAQTEKIVVLKVPLDESTEEPIIDPLKNWAEYSVWRRPEAPAEAFAFLSEFFDVDFDEASFDPPAIGSISFSDYIDKKQREERSGLVRTITTVDGTDVNIDRVPEMLETGRMKMMRGLDGIVRFRLLPIGLFLAGAWWILNDADIPLPMVLSAITFGVLAIAFPSPDREIRFVGAVVAELIETSLPEDAKALNAMWKDFKRRRAINPNGVMTNDPEAFVESFHSKSGTYLRINKENIRLIATQIRKSDVDQKVFKQYLKASLRREAFIFKHAATVNGNLRAALTEGAPDPLDKAKMSEATKISFEARAYLRQIAYDEEIQWDARTMFHEAAQLVCERLKMSFLISARMKEKFEEKRAAGMSPLDAARYVACNERRTDVFAQERDRMSRSIRRLLKEAKHLEQVERVLHFDVPTMEFFSFIFDPLYIHDGLQASDEELVLGFLKNVSTAIQKEIGPGKENLPTNAFYLDTEPVVLLDIHVRPGNQTMCRVNFKLMAALLRESALAENPDDYLKTLETMFIGTFIELNYIFTQAEAMRGIMTRAFLNPQPDINTARSLVNRLMTLYAGAFQLGQRYLRSIGWENSEAIFKKSESYKGLRLEKLIFDAAAPQAKFERNLESTKNPFIAAKRTAFSYTFGSLFKTKNPSTLLERIAAIIAAHEPNLKMKGNEIVDDTEAFQFLNVPADSDSDPFPPTALLPQWPQFLFDWANKNPFRANGLAFILGGIEELIFSGGLVYVASQLLVQHTALPWNEAVALMSGISGLLFMSLHLKENIHWQNGRLVRGPPNEVKIYWYSVFFRITFASLLFTINPILAIGALFALHGLLDAAARYLTLKHEPELTPKNIFKGIVVVALFGGAWSVGPQAFLAASVATVLGIAGDIAMFKPHPYEGALTTLSQAVREAMINSPENAATIRAMWNDYVQRLTKSTVSPLDNRPYELSYTYADKAGRPHFTANLKAIDKMFREGANNSSQDYYAHLHTLLASRIVGEAVRFARLAQVHKLIKHTRSASRLENARVNFATHLALDARGFVKSARYFRNLGLMSGDLGNISQEIQGEESDTSPIPLLAYFFQISSDAIEFFERETQNQINSIKAAKHAVLSGTYLPLLAYGQPLRSSFATIVDAAERAGHVVIDPTTKTSLPSFRALAFVHNPEYIRFPKKSEAEAAFRFLRRAAKNLERELRDAGEDYANNGLRIRALWNDFEKRFSEDPESVLIDHDEKIINGNNDGTNHHLVINLHLLYYLITDRNTRGRDGKSYLRDVETVLKADLLEQSHYSSNAALIADLQRHAGEFPLEKPLARETRRQARVNWAKTLAIHAAAFNIRMGYLGFYGLDLNRMQKLQRRFKGSLLDRIMERTVAIGVLRDAISTDAYSFEADQRAVLSYYLRRYERPAANAPLTSSAKILQLLAEDEITNGGPLWIEDGKTRRLRDGAFHSLHQPEYAQAELRFSRPDGFFGFLPLLAAFHERGAASLSVPLQIALGAAITIGVVILVYRRHTAKRRTDESVEHIVAELFEGSPLRMDVGSLIPSEDQTTLSEQALYEKYAALLRRTSKYKSNGAAQGNFVYILRDPNDTAELTRVAAQLKSNSYLTVLMAETADKPHALANQEHIEFHEVPLEHLQWRRLKQNLPPRAKANWTHLIVLTSNGSMADLAELLPADARTLRIQTIEEFVLGQMALTVADHLLLRKLAAALVTRRHA